MEKEKIIKVLKDEIERHSQEIIRHSELYQKNHSKRQFDKMVKHIHKKEQTKLIAKNLGLVFCECCGGLK